MTEAVRNLGEIADEIPGGRMALIDLRSAEPLMMTYDAFRAEIRAVARGLSRLGLKRGDRIGILALNRAEYLTVMFGAALGGMIPVPFNVKVPVETLRAILKADPVSLIIVETDFSHLVPEGIGALSFESDYRELLDCGPFDPVPVVAGDVSMQPYTSGSTGLPKGVLLTHAGQFWAAETLVEYRRLKSDDRGILAAPLYHKNALVAAKTALRSGGSSVLVPRFEAGRYARAIADWDVTMLTGVPTMMRMLLDDPNLPTAEAREGVRLISMGSSAASERLLADLVAAFPSAEIHQNYGVTEGGPIMFGWYHPRGVPRPVKSIGYPIPGCEWKIDGEAGNEGELWVKNPGVAKGYYNRAEATAKAFRDGWYRTGDILRYDEDGWFYFVARKDDMMVVGGENVFPQEIEAVLETHAAVRQAAVLAVPHEIKGEVPIAFVVLQDGKRTSEDELKQFALANAPAYAHPRRVFFLPKIPLTGTNKIDKPALMQIAAQSQQADTQQERGTQ
jgi:acyl-CoA synthetase (AMP-forming)/AMP-acid ligase II